MPQCEKMATENRVEFTFFAEQRVNFESAVQFCLDRGQSLARISSRQEFDLVREESLRSGLIGSAWIGIMLT